MSWESVRPLHAVGYYLVDARMFRQLITFVYHDPEGFFLEATRSKKRLDEETERFRVGMKEVLDQERVLFNGREVDVSVSSVVISSDPARSLGLVSYVLESRLELKLGEENTYENSYEPGVAEYGYEAVWVFPPGTEIIEVVSPSRYEIQGHVLVFLASKGDEYDGYEAIRFRLPRY